MPLLITDLDNTLYDWVTFFALSFRSLVEALVEDIGVDREKLLDEFKVIHQMHGDSEYPFAALELPSVRAKYGDKGTEELKNAIDHAFHAFNKTRKMHLKLYDFVETTLATLRNADVIVVGHTEAMAVNGFFRLKHLGIARYFRRLYALEGRDFKPGFDDRLNDDFIRLVPRVERKPNPRLVHDICESEGVEPADTWYVGDSLTRDIGMAKAAGVHAVWARYGTQYDGELWNSLVRITHWTAEDVTREAELRRACRGVEPDFTIDSFAEILPLMRIG
ncbi:MAG TPA: HAD-IA family hydrolase [Planctomycetaceae bacterium]|jgi:FMN phosphatase YigB (HAD superfamily)|nr:HAD-IA family hydrolase [Planctomycetaceae bacterium]